MDTRSLLDQLLKSGQSLLDQGRDSQAGKEVLGKLSTPGGAAVAGGVLGLLLGNKKARKMAGQAAAWGGVAALGVLAWKALQKTQQQPAATGAAEPASLPSPQPIELQPQAQVEQRSRAILKALICAARADGHIDAREQALLDEQFAALAAGDPALRQWLQLQLNAPLDPAALAAEASSRELAAEMYLASVLMVDQENFMERAWLNELARLMHIDAALQAELEQQVREASAS